MSRGVAGGVLPPGINGPAEFAAWLELYRANVRIYFGYRPPPFGGRVVLFRSAEPGGPKVPPLLGWDQVARGRVEAVTVPGDHFTMVTEPRVEHLARELEARLGR
jgi:thioesterase domain-containing protein